MFSDGILGRRGSVLTPLPDPGSFKRKEFKGSFKKIFSPNAGGCPAGYGGG